jgi:micrococcal nuclease
LVGLVAATLVAACGASPGVPSSGLGTDSGTGGPGWPTAGASGSPPASASASAPASPSIPVAPSGAPDRPTGPTEIATLVRVVDGDTIRVVVGGTEERVRYIGMDTPELFLESPATPQPYAEAATRENARLLAGATTLILERDVSERDRYGRLLRDIWIEDDGVWLLVNLALVAEGYAQVATFPPDVKYVDALRAAERSARAGGLGLWGTGG